MAHTELFYNIDESVGKGKQNEASDVLLVKFFLKEIAEASKTRPNEALGQPFVPPAAPLPLDGTPSEDFFLWIKTYQEIKKKSSWVSFAPDGIVSPVPPDNVQATRQVPGTNRYETRDRYTLYALNLEYKNFFPKSWADLAHEPKAPGVLCNELRDRLGF